MIIKMAEKTGALVVAEGIEEYEEAMTLLQFGAQLLQGFYIAEPMDMAVNTTRWVEEKIDKIALFQKDHLARHLEEKCAFNLKLRDTFERFNQILSASKGMTSSDTLKWILESFPEVECAYVINVDGHQMSDTVFNANLQEVHRKSLFRPLKRGDDATLKAYYYVLMTTNQRLYVSEEYLSLATGHKCITISGYAVMEGERVVLCLDIVYGTLSTAYQLKGN